MRRFAIGDVHGCSKPLRTLLETIDPQPEDEIVFLGDYVDRGPDSRGVVDIVIELKKKCNVIALRGNHEVMLQSVIEGKIDPEFWLGSGGAATVTSYGGSVTKVPELHIDFFTQLLPFYETEEEIFVHANYEPQLPMDEQRDEIIFWTHLRPPLPTPHVSGKRVFVGHTPQPFGEIFNYGYLVGIDTYCFGHGYLTAYDFENEEVIQANFHGHLRRFRRREIRKWMVRKAKAASAWFGSKVDKKE